MRIWFNHWFSTVSCIMDWISNGLDNTPYEFIGTSTNKNAVYKEKCDLFFEEPKLFKNTIDYVYWCLDFCKVHNINVFIPRREKSAIIENLSLFEELGVKVLADTNNILDRLLQDKLRTNEYFAEHNICETPELCIVNNYEDFLSKYTYLKEKYPDDRICIKLNNDEGATSFRVISEEATTVKSLRSFFSHKANISYTELIGLLKKLDTFEDLLIMPYLEGPEISIDSLMTSNGFIGVCRIKKDNRVTEISYIPELVDISKRFAEISGLKTPYNLQLRYHKGTYYLLEVNTRMAGGTHKTCEFGVNIPYIALCELLGIPFDLPKVDNLSPMYISQIETPVIL